MTDASGQGLLAAIQRLTTDPEHAICLAQRSIEVGIRDFSYDVVRDNFFSHLRSGIGSMENA